MTEISPVYLYILMRTDMASMNAGKAVAQGAHAANASTGRARASNDPKLHALLAEWEAQAGDHCGTTITLGVNEAQMRRAVTVAQGLGLHAGIFHDPTYPLLDGDVLHLIPLDTAGFVLARKSDAAWALQGLELMP